MSDSAVAAAKQTLAEANAKAAADAAAAKQARVENLAARGWDAKELPRGEGFEARKWFQERGCYRVQRGGTLTDLEAGIDALEAYIAPRDHD